MYWSKGRKDYKPSKTISFWIKSLLLPVFKDLMDEDLLKKFVHGKTRNANEALSGLKWSRLTKTVFVSRETIVMGVNSAIIHFNDGSKGILKVLEHFGLKGQISKVTATSLDNSRIKRMEKKFPAAEKKHRKGLRARRKGVFDNMNEKESVDSYQTGAY